MADFTAGRIESARDEMQRVIVLDPSRTHSVQVHLQKTLPHADDVLSVESRQILQQAETDRANEERYGIAPSRTPSLPYVTYALFIVNTAYFIVELILDNGGEKIDSFYRLVELIVNGGQNIDTLYRLGALIPASVLDAGEWWRLLASMFMHFGILHIAGNMLALLVFSPYIERTLGKLRHILIYFGAGLGVGVVIIILSHSGIIDPQEFIVGASGAIMGLLGATAAIMYRGWRVDKAPVARQRFVFLLTLVVFEAVFDMIALGYETMLFHLIGAIIGFILASLMSRQKPTVA